MTARKAGPGDVLNLAGDPFTRGASQAIGAPVDEVRATLAHRLTIANEAGAFGAGAQDYLDDQRRFAERHCPNALAEVAGIAEGFGIPEHEVFAHLYIGTLTDLAHAAATEEDGCSTWATADGPDGPLVVKNRDFSGRHAGIQRVFRHEGPDLDHGPMLCLGSLGAPGAYSSGMNAAGLAVVDTQVGVRHHATGWLRYFLMTEVLSKTATVADALALIREVPHAGGGTLVLGDRSGAVAAVELGASAVAIELAPLVCRTNHFTTTALAPDTRRDTEDRIDANSAGRRTVLDATLPGAVWNIDAATRLMARHEGAGPLCQHGAEGQSQTIASVVYCCRDAHLYACLSNPCSGTWLRFALGA